MRFLTTLAYVTLAIATTPPQPITSSNSDQTACSSQSIIEGGWGAMKLLFNNSSKITNAIYERFDSLSTSLHTWYELQFPDAGESLDEIVELGPNIKEYADELFHHAVELYPSEKLPEFRESVTDAAIALREVCNGAVEDSGIFRHSVLEEYGDILAVLFEDLMDMCLSPGEAPGHDNRTIKINAILDRFEGGFLQVATKLRASEELLKSHLSSLKSAVQHVTVTIGDLVEQYPDIADALLQIAITELSPLLLPEIGTLFEGRLIRLLLRMFAFGP